jgi:hypothetical protein
MEADDGRWRDADALHPAGMLRVRHRRSLKTPTGRPMAGHVAIGRLVDVAYAAMNMSSNPSTAFSSIGRVDSRLR